MKEERFRYNDRLGIPIPSLKLMWEEYKSEEQEEILSQWEMIRGGIPDRIKELEAVINRKQALLQDEHDFQISCLLNQDIADVASIINDLHLWYRTHQSIEVTKAHA
ncbi:hypothetical protein [Longirhabdus pacifica]|uniref:hypothetical protein n=1 Tax=Longirhabdus pacifica TaxID=2305227 RepID=UPI001008FFC3|nr:hypothetical protein [Longirhabdus pacifica]